MTAKPPRACATVQARLAAATPTADLADHLARCRACADYSRQLARLDAGIPRLPVEPSRPGLRAETLALVAERPIIVPRPESATLPPATTRLARLLIETRESWQYAAGVAAVLVAGVSLYLAAVPQQRPEVARVRHPLLERQVRSIAQLSTADTAEDRLKVWTEVGSDLVAEAEQVYVGASGEDLALIDRLFAQAVADGVVRQAKQLPPNLTAPERRARLAPAIERATAWESATKQLLDRAPVQAEPALKNLARTATECRQTLAAVARPEV